MKKILFITIGLLMAYMSYGQINGASCSNPAIIEHTDGNCENFQVQNNQLWLKFTATTNTINLSVDRNYQLNAINLYSGTCGSQTSLANSSNRDITYSNLIVNSDYYINIQGENEGLSISIINTGYGQVPNCNNISLSPCNKVHNGDFSLGTYNVASGPDLDCFQVGNQEVPGWVGNTGVGQASNEVIMVSDAGEPVARLAYEPIAGA